MFRFISDLIERWRTRRWQKRLRRLMIQADKRQQPEVELVPAGQMVTHAEAESQFKSGQTSVIH